jgi:hypothetical protein
MADEQVGTNGAGRDEGSARDLVEAFKKLVGIGDDGADDDREGSPDEPDGSAVSVASAVSGSAGAGAGAEGALQGTLDGTGATAGADVDAELDTGLGGQYDGSAEGEVSIDPVEGSVEGAVDVSIGQEDVLSGKSEGEVEGNVRFGPTSFGVGAEASASQTDPLGVDTGSMGAGGSYHHDVDGSGVEAGAGLEGTVDAWAGDEYHGEAEANLGVGHGAVDVDGSVELTHTAPFGVASESFEAEGQAHADSSGWDVNADVGYELDVGGGAPEVALGGGFSTTGEWSDVGDAASDAGDAAQDTANDVGGAAEDTYESAEDEVNDWF